ncbi:MAG: phosphopantothenoylcysteine decarboxylase [Planctomycetota bacterium]
MSTPATTSWFVAAGPTHEPIDQVRYIGNRSSGSLGVCIADAASDTDDHAMVELALGPSCQAPNRRVRLSRFVTTDDLKRLMRDRAAPADIVVMAAAVADFRLAEPHAGKLPRNDAASLELVPTPDLLQCLMRHRQDDQLTVGFALEHEDTLDTRASEKLARKGVDVIIANPLRTMESATIEAKVFASPVCTPAFTGCPSIASKADFARWLVEACDRALAIKRDPSRLR